MWQTLRQNVPLSQNCEILDEQFSSFFVSVLVPLKFSEFPFTFNTFSTSTMNANQPGDLDTQGTVNADPPNIAPFIEAVAVDFQHFMASASPA